MAQASDHFYGYRATGTVTMKYGTPYFFDDLARTDAAMRERVLDAVLWPVPRYRCEPLKSLAAWGVCKFRIGQNWRVWFREEEADKERVGILLGVGPHSAIDLCTRLKSGLGCQHYFSLEDVTMKDKRFNSANGKPSGHDGASPLAGGRGAEATRGGADQWADLLLGELTTALKPQWEGVQRDCQERIQSASAATLDQARRELKGVEAGLRTAMSELREKSAAAQAVIQGRVAAFEQQLPDIAALKGSQSALREQVDELQTQQQATGPVLEQREARYGQRLTTLADNWGGQLGEIDQRLRLLMEQVAAGNQSMQLLGERMAALETEWIAAAGSSWRSWTLALSQRMTAFARLIRGAIAQRLAH